MIRAVCIPTALSLLFLAGCGSVTSQAEYRARQCERQGYERDTPGFQQCIAAAERSEEDALPQTRRVNRFSPLNTPEFEAGPMMVR